MAAQQGKLVAKTNDEVPKLTKEKTMEIMVISEELTKKAMQSMQNFTADGDQMKMMIQVHVD